MEPSKGEIYSFGTPHNEFSTAKPKLASNGYQSKLNIESITFNTTSSHWVNLTREEGLKDVLLHEIQVNSVEIPSLYNDVADNNSFEPDVTIIPLWKANDTSWATRAKSLSSTTFGLLQESSVVTDDSEVTHSWYNDVENNTSSSEPDVTMISLWDAKDGTNYCLRMNMSNMGAKAKIQVFQCYRFTKKEPSGNLYVKIETSEHYL